MQIEQLLDLLRLPLIYLITVAVVILSIAIGFRLGSYARRHQEGEKKLSLGTLIGAMLGLLAFLLAFTFSKTYSRYDARKQLVLEEANAIETAVLRADFLSEPARTESRKLLKEYVNIRVEVVENPEKLPQAIANSEAIQNRLWSQASAVYDRTKDPGVAVYIQSLNEIIDLHSKRVTVALHYRIPQTIWFLLDFLTVLAMLAVGYEFGINGMWSFSSVLLLALMFSAVKIIIMDLDRPRLSVFLKVSQTPMIELQRKLDSSVR